MSKFLYLFIILGLALGAYSYADEGEDMKCPEGMIYDPIAKTCVVAAEMDKENAVEMKDEKVSDDRVLGEEPSDEGDGDHVQGEEPSDEGDSDEHDD